MGASTYAGTKREAVETQPVLNATGPLTALISLNKQRLYVYDANGLVVQSRVSTGTSGYDTPKGIYSIIHKKLDHASNLYEGAPMPHMQRLLWSGIALHGGEVPRYPASHGCVRLPYKFAETFYSVTKLNDRVIISPDVQAPVRVSHRLLFAALPLSADKLAVRFNANEGETQLAAIAGSDAGLMGLQSGRTIEQVLAERDAERTRLTTAAETARAELAMAEERVAPAEASVKFAEKTLKMARADERALAKAVSRTVGPSSKATDRLAGIRKRIAAGQTKLRADRFIALQAEEEKAREKAERTRAQYETAKAVQTRAKSALLGYERMLAEAIANVKAAKSELTRLTADEASARAALEAFQLVDRNFPKPLSIFISSKTRMISLRQGMEPVAEGPVTISEPNRPLGTYVFTATGWRDDSGTALNWNVVGVSEKGETGNPRGRDADADKLPPPASAAKAQAALDRIVSVPPHVAAKIAELIKPGSTFIISDYDMSRSETGKGTDFIVQMPEVVAPSWTPEYLAMKKRGRRPPSNGYAFYDPLYDYGDMPGPAKFRFGKPIRIGKGGPAPPPAQKEVIYKPNPRWYRPSLARQFGFSFD